MACLSQLVRARPRTGEVSGSIPRRSRLHNFQQRHAGATPADTRAPRRRPVSRHLSDTRAPRRRHVIRHAGATSPATSATRGRHVSATATSLPRRQLPHQFLSPSSQLVTKNFVTKI